MNVQIKQLMRRLLNKETYQALTEWWVLRTDGFARKSYAQEAEDLIIDDLMLRKDAGFYVDVGAYHPVRFSNTYRFYKSGWRGLNIDAMPGSMKKFRHLRPRDINIEAAISSSPQTLTFHVFPERALNTLHRALAESRARESGSAYESITVQTRTLTEVLETCLPPGQTIDYLTLDVELHELDVLQSNDWQRFRPSWLLVECLDQKRGKPESDPVYAYLTGLGYRQVAQTRRTVFFAAPETVIKRDYNLPGGNAAS